MCRRRDEAFEYFRYVRWHAERDGFLLSIEIDGKPYVCCARPIDLGFIWLT